MINKDFQTFLKKQKLNRKTNIVLEANFDNLSQQFENTNDFIETLVDFFDSANIVVPTFTDVSIKNNDQFDLSTKTDCGVISQAFVDLKDKLRTIHPTHSFCIVGKDKLKLGSKHEKDKTPLGKKCPLGLMPAGKLIFIDSDINKSSYMTYLEEINKLPYLFDKTSNTYFINNRPAKFKTYIKNKYGFKPKYDEIISLLNVEPLYFNNAKIYILDMKQVKNAFTQQIKENPYYFVKKD
jgi:aminoglycoside 3-N-acetyltransferase